MGTCYCAQKSDETYVQFLFHNAILLVLAGNHLLIHYGNVFHPFSKRF